MGSARLNVADYPIVTERENPYLAAYLWPGGPGPKFEPMRVPHFPACWDVG
jgi:hypothetical protein